MEVAADENHSPHAASQPTAKMAAAADMLLDAECFAEDVVDGLDEDLDECGEEEIFATNTCEGGGDDEFEMMVMHLETVMMDPAFNERVGTFMRSHCHEFDEGEEKTRPERWECPRCEATPASDGEETDDDSAAEESDGD